MKLSLISFTAIFTVSLLISPLSAKEYKDARVYKWVDKDGVVHYSDKPNPQIESSEIKVQANSNNFDSTGAEKWQEDYNKNKEVNKEAQDKLAVQNAKKKELCNGFKSDLNTLKNIGRIVNVDADGKQTYISEEDRTEKIQALEKNIKKMCK
ncbi:DUF4124 domain-containing protein [Colwellia sp. RSH04]|uniref:DUF4124 domain-containing protein n=1 Tax=Colwellia sp. RSH04 TaxID=2305464 RepID=UPI000E58BC41|nr:DUF4124 domain-containing protein [Colwellia sp. RSH04]RHW77016.1 DUF4124 domain-containing protein [Colwellia sp. RSH04]